MIDPATLALAREPEVWNPGEFADLLDSVIGETGENLEILSRDLVVLERSGATPELVNRCFRAAHNLKGLSQVIVIQKLTLLAREMENLLEEVRKGRRPPSAPLIDVLLRATDTIRDGILPHMVAKSPIVTDLSAMVAALVAERTRPATPPASPAGTMATPPVVPAVVPPAPAAAAPSPFTPPAAAATDNPDPHLVVREVETWNPGEFTDLLASVTEETAENLDVLSRDLVALEKSATPEQVNRCFRAAHNLKGLSHVIVIRKLTVLAREMENLLEEVRKGRRTPSAHLIDTLLRTTDAIREHILSALRAQAPVTADLTPILDALIAEHRGEAAPLHTPAATTAAAPAPHVPPPMPPTAPPASPPAPAPTVPPAPIAGPGSAPKADTPTETRVATRSNEVQDDRILRVGQNKLDDLMNQVGELVIGRTRFEAGLVNFRELHAELTRFQTRLDEVLRSRRDEQRIALLGGEIDNLLWKHSLTVGSKPDWVTLRQEVANTFAAYRPTFEQHSVRGQVGNLREEINRVGRAFEELVRELEESLHYVGLISDQLQSEVMKVRMVPIGQLFNKFPRMVRDLCRKLGKEAEVVTHGANTELDKMLVDLVSEPLMHVVRNALDHGIETPEERRRAGKPPAGTIRLSADHQGGEVHLTITDDGRGIDPVRIRDVAIRRGLLRVEDAGEFTQERAIEFLFKPGFSTAAAVTDISGRGVGMDVVREAIAALKGSIFLDSTVGRGTSVRIRVPLTLAIINTLLVMKNNEVFAIPLTAVREMLTIEPRQIRSVGNRQVVNCRGESLFIRWLDDILGIEGTAWEERHTVPLVVISNERGRLGIAVDRLLGRQDVVIKNLGTLLKRVRCTLGSTILGDGRAILILDPNDLIEFTEHAPVRAMPAPAVVPMAPPRSADGSRHAPANILLADDSKSLRSKMREYLSQAGYQVVEAEDGQHALELAQQTAFDLVSSDINMPRMDGFELVKSLRKLPQYRRTPILLISTKSEKMDRIRGFDAGADDYLVKPFNRDTFLNTVRNNLRQ